MKMFSCGILMGQAFLKAIKNGEILIYSVHSDRQIRMNSNQISFCKVGQVF